MDSTITSERPAMNAGKSVRQFRPSSRPYFESPSCSVRAGALLVALAAIVSGATDPTPPQVFLDTHYVTPTGTTRTVNSGGDLQAAIDAAQPGDEIVLQAGARFVGNYILRAKAGSSWITIRSSQLSSLPEGTRVGPGQVSSMATISSPNVAPAIDSDPGANFWRIAGIELTVEANIPSNLNYGIALGYMGNGVETMSQLPTDIIFDRTWIHGTPTCQCKRGVTFNGKRLAVVDSQISDIHVAGQDTQAIIGYNGPGPFKIVNNELEAAGENVMFGGADPAIANLVPSDMEIRRNHFFKPLTWNISNPSYGGTHWTVKNLLEIKNGQRIIIDGNIFENSWVDGQNGVAIVLKSSNQNDGVGCPQCFGGDILFSNNIIKGAVNGFSLVGQEAGPASAVHNPAQAPVLSARIKITNVLVYSVYNLFVLTMNPGTRADLANTTDVQITHLTAFDTNSIMGIDVGDAGTISSPRFLFRDSIVERQTYGVGAGSPEGKNYLDSYFAPYGWDHMLLLNSSGIYSNTILASIYPSGTSLATGYTGFVNYGGGIADYHGYALTSSSLGYKAASDGTNMGVDFAALDAALQSNSLPQSTLSCDLNSDGAVNVLDVQLATNQVLGYAACGSADLNGDGQCTVVDVQRTVSASLGASCHLGL